MLTGGTSPDVAVTTQAVGNQRNRVYAVFSPRRAGFNTGRFHETFVVDKATLEQGFVRVPSSFRGGTYIEGAEQNI
jgi:hypothetical protein